MTRNKKTTKAKEPIRLRMKNLKNGNKSLYLDTYRDGKRSYEFLKLYLVPETDKNTRRQNHATLTAAYKIKADRIIEFTNREAGISQAHKGQKYTCSTGCNSTKTTSRGTAEKTDTR